MLKKQRAAVIIMAVAIVLLIAALIAVYYLIGIYSYEDVDGTDYIIRKVNGNYELCYTDGTVLDKTSDGYYQTDAGTQVQINPGTGEWSRYAVVDTEGTEVLGYSQLVLMFKQLTYDASSTKDQSKVIKSIEVHNDNGSYTFNRGEKSNYFYIKDHEDAPYSLESFAQLAVACGYTISSLKLKEPAKLPDGSIDYSEYGLAESDAPAWYVITTMTGESHKVYIGDVTVTGTGYYAKYDGRDSIYVLGANGMEDLVLGRIETFLTPMIAHPTGETGYFNVKDFKIYNLTNEAYESIYQELEDIFGDPDKIEDESIEFEEFSKKYDELFEKYSKKACHFSYTEIADRQNTMYSYIPYKSEIEFAGGYYINSDNIDKVLYALYSTDFTGVEKLSPTEEDFAKYGLDYAPFVISYFIKTTNEKNEKIYVDNYIQISKKMIDEKTGEGIFYAYSPAYDMIVGIHESSLNFLYWNEIEWYDKSYIQLDITYVENIIVESPDINVNFEIEDSGSRYMTYVAQSGRSFTDGKLTYNIVKDSKTGKYVLSKGSTKLSPIYTGDYLITPLPYSPGVAEADNYLFVETKKYDANDDGKDDATAYYFYNIGYHAQSGQYRLYSQTIIADSEGKKLDEKVVWGEPYASTDYFITNSGYVYLTAKDSYIGSKLDEKYGKNNRGRWGAGMLFITADDRFVLVNNKTAEWAIMDDISCNIYFADENNSRLAQRAISIPALVENGTVKRYPETYYPTSERDLKFNESTGKICVVQKDGTLKNATYQECTIGEWSTGSYYAIEGGALIAVNSLTGDWGIVTISANETYCAEIYANDIRLDYVIKTTNHVNRVVDTTAMDNFKQFYGSTLYASLEGMAELSEDEKIELKKHDDFDTGENACQLKITVLGCDFYGNRRDIVYRFYQYTERKSYITIEVLGEDGNSNSENGYGNFYVLRSFADKIIEDAKRMVNGQEIDSTSKY